MDCSLPGVVPDDGDLPWPNLHATMDSDDHSMALAHAQRWIDNDFAICTAPAPAAILTSAAAIPRVLHRPSPIRTGLGLPMIANAGSCPPSATAPAMVHSASSSSCTDSWNMGLGDSDDLSAEEGAPDLLAVAKPEPMDDDFICLDNLQEAPRTPLADNDNALPTTPKVKRPRGRPRKYPVPRAANPANKVHKGRSKTGCITCRKRKKKCDEAKPRCMNCEKNGVVCEGYPEKQIWKSGRERAEEARRQVDPLSLITMQPLFDGLETLEDRIFWKHYNDHLSTVLTVENEHRNAFKDMLIPIATQHQGLMHSILSLSSKHIDYNTPYAMNLLKRYPGTSIEALRERSSHHQTRAMQVLTNVDHMSSDANVRSAFYGQMLCLILENMAEGRADGQHRFHLDAYHNLINNSPPQDAAFVAFITEYFQYHIFADELIRYPSKGLQPRLAAEGWEPAQPILPARLLGVADGLFNHLCEITTIRNRIRENIAAQLDPVVDYPSLYKAEEIVQAIYDWNPCWPPGDSRERVALLYKQMMWVHLYRTIYPPLASSLSSSNASAADSATSLMTTDTMYTTDPNPTVHTPPKSTSTSRSSSPRLRPSTAGTWSIGTHPHTHGMMPLSPRRHSISIAHLQSSPAGITIATPSSASDPPDHHPHPAAAASSSPSSHIRHRPDSPPPIRLPPHQDPRIALAVDESLAILDALDPADPAQTLLLIPCLVVGAACFAPAQQERVRSAVRRVRGYTGMRNADRVEELLGEVWQLMAEGEWLAVWDWQGVASRLGLDFLCA